MDFNLVRGDNVKTIAILLMMATLAFAEVRHDSRGNMIEDTWGRTFTYDAQNNMLTMTTSGETIAWTYDSNNNVISRTNPDGTVIIF